MLATRLFKFYPNKSKLRIFSKNELFPKSLAFVNQAFSCIENENPKPTTCFVKDYYRQYLLNNSEYRNLIFRENDIKANTKTSTILSQMCQEGQNNSDLNAQLSCHLDKELSQFNFSEFCEVAYFILKCKNENPNDPFWEKILVIIQEECLKKISTYTVDEMIRLTDASMVYSKTLKFKNKLMYKLCKKSSTSHQITALFYFLMMRKFEIPKEYLFNLSERLKNILPEINSFEAAIIAEGFINSCPHLKTTDFINGILMKAVKEAESINHTAFNSVCKVVRGLSNYSNLKGILVFQEKLINTALRFGTEYVIKLALSGQNVNYINSDLRNVLMKEVKEHIKELSIFHIERVTYIGTKVNIHDEEFLKMVVEALETEGFTEKNKREFLFVLNHLIHYQVYPKKSLEHFFNQKFMDNILDESLDKQVAWWQIYCSLEIDKPEFLTSFVLAPKIRNKLYQKSRIKFIFQHEKHNLHLIKGQVALEELFGKEFVNWCMPLPHYPEGLLMRFDKNSKPQQFPEEFKSFKKSFIIKPLKDDHIWMFIIVGYFSNQADFSKNILNYISLTQVRQLNDLGYTPLFVNRTFKIGKTEFKEFLKNLIDAKLDECCKDQKGEIL